MLIDDSSEAYMINTAEHIIPESLLYQLSEYINQHLGLYFPKERWRALTRSMAAAAKDLGISGQDSHSMLKCIRHLLSSPPSEFIINTLARRLTIGETYFFRDNYLFDVLREYLLPELIESRQNREKQLRCWSAGCCTGEEPYTLSIMLDQLLPDIQTWNIMILGTDINTDFLEKARQACYTSWSFREIPKWVFNTYFYKNSDFKGYCLKERIKHLVTFKQHNLAEAMILEETGDFSSMDIILCRNVLMYFKPEQRSIIIDQFARVLIEGGWFVISPAENGYVKHELLKPVNFSGVQLFRKITRLTRPAANSSVLKPIRRVTVDTNIDIDPIALEAQAESSIVKPSAYQQALDFFQQQQFAQAVETLYPLIENTGSSAEEAAVLPEIQYLMSRALAALGDVKSAIRFCEQAADAVPGNSDIHYQLAVLYQEIGRFDEAKNTLKHVMVVEANHIGAYFSLGTLLLMENRKHEGKRLLEKALELAARLPENEILPYRQGLNVAMLTDIIRTLLAERTC